MAWVNPTSDLFTTHWLNQLGATANLYLSVGNDPEFSADPDTYCEAQAGASELSFNVAGLPEPGSVIDCGLHGICVISFGVEYFGVGVANVVLRDHAENLIASSGTELNLWGHGAGGFHRLPMAVYEPNRGVWDLAGGDAKLRMSFADDWAGSTYLDGFRLASVALEMSGSGTPGGGTGPGGARGPNAPILIPLMVQP